MKEIARNSLEKALPTKLLNMASSNRADAVNMIESRSQYLVNQVIRREFHNENEFEIDEFDVNHTACQIRANSNLKRSFVRNALKTSNNLKPNHIPNWSDDSLWKDFLSTVIVRLWLLLLNLTAEECREQYLSSARRSIGYGAVNFYPSAIRINMMTLQEECEFTGPTGVVKIDIENSGSNDDDGYYTSSKIPIWTTLQTEYSCNTRSRQSSDSTNLTRVTTTIQVDINFREVLVTEHSITETDILEDKTRIKITSNIKSKKVIIKIMIDEILSWGYNENTVILKFKKRGYGHEASYYSDDDENDTNDNNIDHDQDETRHQELQVDGENQTTIDCV